jgi:CrcB protein
VARFPEKDFPDGFTEASAFYINGKKTRKQKVRKYVFIAAGGALGALLRHLLTNPAVQDLWGAIPAGTLAANLAGCFALAFFLTISLEVLHISPHVRLGIATGALGAFTTFSGVCREAAALISSGVAGVAAVYILLTVLCGFGATYLGVVLAREAEHRKIRAADKAGAAESGEE